MAAEKTRTRRAASGTFGGPNDALGQTKLAMAALAASQQKLRDGRAAWDKEQADFEAKLEVKVQQVVKKHLKRCREEHESI